METKRVLKYAALCLLFIFLGFGSGYLTSMAINSMRTNKTTTQNTHEDIEIYRPQPTPDATVSSEPDSKTHYLLKNENNVLSLYEVTGEESKLIKQTEIDTFFLPAEDIQKLKNGIELTTEEEGFELIEDFTS